MRLALGFERQTGIHPEATDHSRKSDAKDVQIVVEVVLKARILEVIDKRCQSKFPNFSPNPLDRIERDTYTCLSTHMYTQTQFVINILMLILRKVGGGGGGGLPFIKSVFGVHNQWL